jgi:hypothetical protein
MAVLWYRPMVPSYGTVSEYRLISDFNLALSWAPNTNDNDYRLGGKTATVCSVWNRRRTSVRYGTPYLTVQCDELQSPPAVLSLPANFNFRNAVPSSTSLPTSIVWLHTSHGTFWIDACLLDSCINPERIE